MPRKEQGWITFQTSEEERRLLEEICQTSQRTKTEVLRELVRGLKEDAAKGAQKKRSRLSSSLTAAGEPAPQAAAPAAPEPSPSGKKLLKVSSRNVLQGKVKRVVSGAVNSEITLEITHPVVLTSIITRASAEELGLEEGQEAYAVIKASDVVIAME